VQQAQQEARPTRRLSSLKRGQVLEVDPAGSISVNDTDVMVTAALDGAGLVCTLEGQVAQRKAAP